MKNGFTVSAVFPAKASKIYSAWMSSDGHTAMTGSPADIEGHLGGKFRVWEGYIFGSILELEPDHRVVQAWRTTEFPDDAPDSRLEIFFEELAEGTKVTLLHSDMPEDQVDSYRQGWEDFYFKPMKEFFGK